MPKDLEDIFSAIVEFCENLKGNEKCYIRGLNDWIDEDTFLKSRSEDIIETNLRELINEAKELIEKYESIEEFAEGSYYKFLREVMKIDEVSDFIHNCYNGIMELNGNVCGTILYYLAKNEYDKIFDDSTIISEFVDLNNYEKAKAIEDITCDEDTCVIEYKGVNADPYYDASMSLDYPILAVFVGEDEGLNQYEDGRVVEPIELIAVMKNPYRQ